MKRCLFLLSILLCFTLTITILYSCSAKNEHKEDADIAYYTCPMHPQIHQDHPGNCPICGMTLVPVQKNPPQPLYEKGGKGGILISPARQQLIGLKTQKVQIKPLNRDIRTTGRVAFDPALAVAQREYLEITKSVPTLKDAARSNLRLKGMSEEEIMELDRAGSRASPMTDLYLPKMNGSVWVYAPLFQSEMDLVKPGDTAQVSLPSRSDKTWEGVVKSIDPILDPMTRSVRARILVEAPIRPETYVDVTLKSSLGSALAIPKSALIDTGTRQFVFVVHDGERFESRDVKTGPETDQEVSIMDGLAEGEIVATSATFLIDSESQLKASVNGMGGNSH